MRSAGWLTMVLWMTTGCGEQPTGATFRPQLEFAADVPAAATVITPERAARVAPVDLAALPPLGVSDVSPTVSYALETSGVAFLPDTSLVRVGMGGQNTTCVLRSTQQGPAPDVDYPGSDDEIIDTLHGATDLGTLVGTDFGAWVEVNEVGGGEEVDLGGVADAVLVDGGVVRLGYTVQGCELLTADDVVHRVAASACYGDSVLTADPRSGVAYLVSEGSLFRADGADLVDMGMAATYASWDPVGAHLLVVTPHGEVLALDSDDAERWRVELPGAQAVFGLGARAGAVVVTADGYAILDAVDGREVWRADHAGLTEVVPGWGGERLALVTSSAVSFVEVFADR